MRSTLRTNALKVFDQEEIRIVPRTNLQYVAQVVIQPVVANPAANYATHAPGCLLATGGVI